MEFLLFDSKKEPYLSQILLKLWKISNRTSCCPISSVIILVIKQIGLPLCGHPILLSTRMTTDWTGLHSVLLPLLIIIIIIIIIKIIIVIIIIIIIIIKLCANGRYSQSNTVGPTMLGVVASVLALVCKWKQQLPTIWRPTVHHGNWLWFSGVCSKFVLTF